MKTKIALFAVLACLLPMLAFADAGPIDAGASEAPAAATTEAADKAADVDPLKLGAEIYGRIKSGEYLPALAGALMLLVWAVRRFGGKLIPWLKTKAGGYTVGLVAAFAVSLSTWATSGEPWSWGVLPMALGAAWAAGGGFDGIREGFGFKKS